MDAKRDPALGDQLTELESKVNGRSLGANLCIGLAGALAITSVVLFFVEGRERRGGSGVALGRGPVVEF